MMTYSTRDKAWRGPSLVLLLAAATLALASPASSYTAMDEYLQQEDIRASTAREFGQGFLERLSARADFMREKAFKTDAGEWKLGLLYYGIDWYAGPQRPASELQKADALTIGWVESMPQSAPAVIAHAIVRRNIALADKGERRVRMLAETVGFLEEHKLLAARDPHWYAMRLRLAADLEISKDRFLALAHEGVHAHPTYTPIHYAVLDRLAAANPADGASIERFIATAADVAGPAEGNGLYARLQLYIARTKLGPTLFRVTSADWPRLKSGIAAIETRHVNDLNTNAFAMLACVAGDRLETRRLLDLMIDKEPVWTIWSQPEWYESCEAWARSDDPQMPAPASALLDL